MNQCIRLDLISAAALSLAACAFVVACNGSDPAPPPRPLKPKYSSPARRRMWSSGNRISLQARLGPRPR